MLSACRPLVLALLISLHTLLHVGEELQGSRAPQSLQSGLSGGCQQVPRIVHNKTKPTTHTHHHHCDTPQSNKHFRQKA